MITGIQARNAGTNFFNDSTALMSQNDGKYSLRILAGQRKRIRMANTGCYITQQHFPFLRSIDFYCFNFKRFARFPGNGGTCLHYCPLVQFVWFTRRCSHDSTICSAGVHKINENKDLTSAPIHLQGLILCLHC